jgi:hypothetical protein
LGIPSDLLSFSSATISSSGQCQLIICTNSTNIYLPALLLSTTYGRSFDIAMSFGNVSCCAISSSGQYIIFGCNPGYIYLSNSGFSTIYSSFSSKNFSGNWISTSISSTGQYQTALNYNDYIYTSQNYGQAWNAITSTGTQSWKTVCVSCNGKNQYALVNTGYFYYSNDYGNTWMIQVNSTTNNWTSFAINSSGKYQIATVNNINNTIIYTSNDYGANFSIVYNNFSNTKSYNPTTQIAVSSDFNYFGLANNLTNTIYNFVTSYSDILASSSSTFLCDVSMNNRLFVNGNITTNNGNVYAAGTLITSDYRIKDNIISLDSTYTVDNLHPIQYYNTILNKYDIGIIAHEVQEQYPILVNGMKDGKSYQNVNYVGFIPILINDLKNIKIKQSIHSSNLLSIQKDIDFLKYKDSKIREKLKSFISQLDSIYSK